MPFLELFDETLDINSTENYELSVQVSNNGLSFCLLDTIRNKFVLIRSFEPEDKKHFSSVRINDIFSKDDFLTRKYRKVNVVLPSPKFTIVPTPLFDPAKQEEYFTFNHTLDEGNIILSNKTETPDAYIIFSVPKQIYDFVNSFLPDTQPCHHIKPLLAYSVHSRKSINGNYIHVHIEREFFNMIIFNNSLLKFCNSFKYKNIYDILYHTMNVLKSLRIGQEETIHFSGLTEKQGELSSCFSQYAGSIRFAGPSGNFTFSYVFNNTELHRFINLFTIINCE